jgi:non-ribosomal peptide synthetase-like protein
VDHPFGDPLVIAPRQLLEEVLILEKDGPSRSSGLAAPVVGSGGPGFGRQGWRRYGTSTVLNLSNGRASLSERLFFRRVLSLCQQVPLLTPPENRLRAPMVLVAAGIAAALVTAMAKWLLMGRYHGGEHPLWSWFVWRDEILNSFQEVVAGPWLLDHSLGSPVMNLYLRAMGTRVGRDVWCDTMTITEFDMVTLSDGCAVNRHACIETHLFHDRIMSIGPTLLGPGSTVGPSSVVLPDTTIGEGCCVGGRSVALRGECLPPRSRWHGTPVAPV